MGLFAPAETDAPNGIDTFINELKTQVHDRDLSEDEIPVSFLFFFVFFLRFKFDLYVGHVFLEMRVIGYTKRYVMAFIVRNSHRCW